MHWDARDMAEIRLQDSGGLHASRSSRPELDEVPCLTAGLPTPDSVQSQKEAHIASLERELREGVAQLAEQHRRKTDELHAKANQQRSQLSLALEKMVKEQEALLDKQHQTQSQQLQEAAQRQLTELNQQAELLVQAWRAQEGHIPPAQIRGLPRESLKVPSGGSMRVAWPAYAAGQGGQGGSMAVLVAPARAQTSLGGLAREQSMTSRSPSHATAWTAPVSGGILQAEQHALLVMTPPAGRPPAPGRQLFSVPPPEGQCRASRSPWLFWHQECLRWPQLLLQSAAPTRSSQKGDLRQLTRLPTQPGPCLPLPLLQVQLLRFGGNQPGGRSAKGTKQSAEAGQAM
eukprot:s6248_g2.t3